MTKRTFRLSDSRPDARRDVDDELAFHLEMRTREFIEQGFSAEEARRRAAAMFGDVQSIRSDLRQERAERNDQRQRRDWWLGLRMDVRYALRSLRKNGAFTAAAIATLGLGIGATLAVFTVVNGVLVRPMPYKDPSRLAMIWTAFTEKEGLTYNLPLASGFFADLQRDARAFDGMAAFRGWSYTLGGDGSESEAVGSARVSPSLFGVLGVRPYLGRTFEPQAASPGGPNEVVISHALWQRRFGEDPRVIGKQVRLSGESFTVIGVMPPGFAFPRGAELPAAFQFAVRTDVWTPLVFDSTDLRNYGTQNLSAIGRIPRNGSLAAAQSDASGIIRRFLQANAPTVRMDYTLVPLAEQAGGTVKRSLLILLGAVFFLLVIACANVASLLVARSSGRQRELAVRAALGAGRGRIARQLVTENLVLAAAGAVVGIVVSYWGTKIMLSLVPGSMPRADDIGVDWRVLSFAAVVAAVAGVVFGVATAYSVRWSRLAAELHSGGTRATFGRARRLGRQLLVTAEVALSLTLLIGATLLTRSFIRLQQVHPGFEASGALAVGVSMPVAGRFNPVADGPKWTAAFNELSARLSQTPGIVAAGAVSSLPLTGAYESGGFRITGRPPAPPGQGPSGQYNVVSGNYFGAARIPLVAGRLFDSSDDAPGAATIIVNREFARRFFASEQDAIGRTITPTFFFSRVGEQAIVGVVDNVKQESLDEDPRIQMYVPQSHLPYPGFTYVIRVDGDPLTSVPVVKRAIREVNPAFSIRDVQTLSDVLEHSLARQRFSMTLIGVFAVTALALAIVGLYGVIALIVGQRRREIGVRMALGARPGDVVRLVLLESSRLSVAGVVLGVLAAFAMTRVLSAMLYDVSTTDLATFGGAAVVVLLVSIAAGMIPARQASRVDPTVTLRAD